MPLLTERYDRALVYAHQLHRSQTRKGSEIPYIAHVLAVSSIALEYGANEDEAIAALLHDAVEDCGGAPVLDSIRNQFGQTVATIVDACSDTQISPKPPWRQRKERYIEHLRQASTSVCLVSASDKLHNVRSLLMDRRKIGESLWERFRGGREGTLWYYRAVASVLEVNWRTALSEELTRAVTEREQQAEDASR